jgi:uncharacterized protein (TIGR02421 family)
MCSQIHDHGGSPAAADAAFIETLLCKIQAGQCIDTTIANDGSPQGAATPAAFDITFDPQYPYVCMAIHNGHAFPEDLQPYCALTAAERLYEEDPHTGDLISPFPNRIIAHDSRYAYDLNRNETQCIYDEAWGKTVWHTPLPAAQQAAQLAKHRAFYLVYEAIVRALLKKHGFCVIYDVHSYNGKRRGDTAAPAFNIGSANIDMRKHRSSVQYLLRQLESITISNEPIRVGLNEVFSGMGHLAQRTRAISPRALCLPIEVRKFFCEEDTAALYPHTFSELKDGLTQAISEHAAFFINKHGTRRTVARHHMLSSDIEPAVRMVDQALFKVGRNMETLLYINPVNIEQERKKFIARKGHYNPEFRYRKLNLDPFLIKEQLYRLPVETINDATLQTLYRRAIDGMSTKVDLLSVIGSKECLYNALRYYGEPDRMDIENARFLLHAPTLPDDANDRQMLSDQEVTRMLQREIDHYRLDAPVKLSSNIVAGAMVDNANFRVLIKKGHGMSLKAANALRHHEVGVHLLTSANARLQPLELFRLGLPGSTEAQEGLAILAEYLSGNLSIDRLKTLALRVMAVHYMLDGHTFSRTYDRLMEEFQQPEEQVFTTTLRVFRGGGFTKDYLYLRGVAKAYYFWKNNISLAPLLVGKTGFADYDRVQELLQREVLEPPRGTPRAFTDAPPSHPIYDYLLQSLKYDQSTDQVA